MKKNSISIAMCTYCGARFLAQQLESIAQQTVKPSEIIVVDDSSHDETINVLREFTSSMTIPVKLLENNENIGVIRNFEKAIGLCRGDIIFLADQDDKWVPEKIESHLEIYVSHPLCGYVFSDAELVDETMQTKGRNLWSAIRFGEERQEAYANGAQLPVMLKGGNFVYGTTMSFRSAYLDLILPLPNSYSTYTHDVWISHLLSSIGAYGVALPEALVMYRQHPNNLAGAGRIPSISDRIQSIRESKRQEAESLVYVYKNMMDRIEKHSSLEVPISLHELESKSKHLAVRGNLSGASRISRYIDTTAELLSGRYNKYSSSWYSFFKDLIF